MDIGFFTDPHISEKIGLSGANYRTESGEKKSLADARDAFHWMIDIFDDNDVDLILCGGDVFDRSNPTSEEYALASEIFIRLTSIAPVISIVGNHSLGHSNYSDAMEPLKKFHNFDRFSNSLSIDRKPNRHEFEDSIIYTLPYPNRNIQEDILVSESDKNEIKSNDLESYILSHADEIDNTDKSTVLLSHVSFDGAKLNEYQSVPQNDIRLNPDITDRFDFVCAGHIHLTQKINDRDTAYHLPPLDKWSFGDESDPFRGCILFDTSEDEFQFRGYEHRIYETINVNEHDNLLEKTESVVEDVDKNRDLYLRFSGDVSDLEKYNDLESTVEKFRESDDTEAVLNNIKVISSDREVDAVDPDEGIEEVFDQYNQKRPDSIPEEKRDEVYHAVKEIL